jgi:hypothetical protein
MVFLDGFSVTEFGDHGNLHLLHNQCAHLYLWHAMMFFNVFNVIEFGDHGNLHLLHNLW